jgi:hypothetical protein
VAVARLKSTNYSNNVTYSIPSYDPFDGDKAKIYRYEVSYRLGTSTYHLEVNSPVSLPKSLSPEFTFAGNPENSKIGIRFIDKQKEISELQQDTTISKLPLIFLCAS